MNAHPRDEGAALSSVAPWLEEACERFEAAMRDGCPLRIEDLLDGCEEKERGTLLRELILVELFYRRSRDESFETGDYLRRFPGIDRDWLSAVLAADSLPPKPHLPSPTPGAPGECTTSPVLSASGANSLSKGGCDFLAPPQNPCELGRLGPYHVLKVLGVGGMGMVFLAHDPQLERPVALKVMRPDVATTPSARQRFLREARAAAAIKHDHIVTIYQVGEDRGTPFLAMELLEGEPLDERLRREGKLSMGELLRISREMAEGLAAAHKRGLIHRDIKPGNVWLEGDGGRVKILDFGLVRAAADGAERTAANASVETPAPPAGPLTQTGAIMGTPAFMAPEQVNGGAVDARCDLFSLGCVLYRMAAGELPFKGDDTAATLLAIVTQTPRPPRELNPELPPDLSDLLMQLLSKQAEGRPASAQTVVESLRSCEGRLAAFSNGPHAATAVLPAALKAGGPAEAGQTMLARIPPRARNGRRLWFAVAAAVLLGILAPVGVLFGPAVLRYASDEGELVIEIDDPQVQAVVDQTGVAIHDRARDRTYRVKPGRHDLPSGDYEIEVTEAGGDLRLFTKEFTITRGGATPVKVTLNPPAVKVGEVRRFEGNEGIVRCVAYAHDGRTILSAGGGLYRGHDFLPGPDNTLYWWDAASGKELHRFEGHASAVDSAAYSPDDKRALCGTNDGTIYLWDLESGKELQRFVGHTWLVTTVAFVADGRQALSSSMDRTIRLWDLESGKEIGRLGDSETQVFSASLSADARLAVSGHHDGALRLWDVPGAKLLQRFAAPQPGWPTPVALDPSGRYAVYGVYRDVTLEAHPIHMLDVRTGKEVRSFKGHMGPLSSVVFSPDGRRVLSAGFDGTVRLWDVGAARELCKLEGHDGRVTAVFSPDGRFAVSGGVDKTVRLWRLPEPEPPEDRGQAPAENGRLEIDAALPDVRVVVKQGGKVIRTISTLLGSSASLQAGEYEVELEGEHEYVGLRPQKFTLAAGGRQIVRGRPDPLLNGTADSARAEAAEDALKALLAREADPKTDGERLRADAAGFLQRYAGTPQTRGAAELLRRLPSPFDRLRREDIPEEEATTAGGGDPEKAPAGLVAVLGDNRLKHWDGALAVQFSPDGKRLATGGKDGLVQLWALPSRRLLHTLAGHKKWVLSVAFSPDGLVLASASHDGTAKLWDAATGKELHALTGHKGLVWSVAFSPDGRTLATGSEDRTIKLWDVATGAELQTLKGHEGDVNCAAFSPDRKTLASASRDGSIRVWDLATGRDTLILADHQAEENTVTFSRDGKTLATSSHDGLVKLWAMPSGKPGRTLTGHVGAARCVAFSPDDKTVASAGFDGTIRLWDVETGAFLRKLVGCQESVHCVAFAPTGPLLASASFDRTVRLWDATTGMEAFPAIGHQGAVGSAAVSPDGQLIASGSDDHTVKLWEAATGRERRTLAGHKGSVWPTAFSADGLKLASGGEEGVVKIWDVAGGNELAGWLAHRNWISSLAFSPDGKTAASGSWDQTTGIWDAATGRKQGAPFKPQQAVYGVAYSPDGKVLASGGDDGLVKLLELASGKVRSLAANHAVTSLAFSQDGRFLAAGGGGTATLWETATGDAHTFRVPGRARLCLAVSPDGATLAASADGVIHLWDTTTGDPKEELRIGPDCWSISQITFSPDGRHLVAANRNDTLYVIRLAPPPMKAPGG